MENLLRKSDDGGDCKTSRLGVRTMPILHELKMKMPFQYLPLPFLHRKKYQTLLTHYINTTIISIYCSEVR